MVEKALLAALVALALVASLSAIAHRINRWATTANCAMTHQTICIYERNAK